MIPRLLSLVAVALFALTGCATSLVPFTHELRDRHGLSEKDLKNLEYYMSTRVTLRRELASDGKQVTGNHRLVIVSGKTIEEVVIEERTPGVAVAVGPTSLTVSFEQGSSFIFAPQGERVVADARRDFAQGPDPFPGNPSGSSSDAPQNPFPGSLRTTTGYALTEDRAGVVTYQGKAFEVVERSAEAVLLIDAEALERVKKTRKVVPGMKLQ